MTTTTLCPDETMTALIASMPADPVLALERVQGTLADYPEDGRLQFLFGSMLASAKRYDEAREAMTRAVALAPYFWIARFQLGLLHLTSGDPDSAQFTWRPIHELPQDNALATFVRGLEAMINDEIADAISLLELGITRNVENPPLNRDMRMMIERLSQLNLASVQSPDEPKPTSAVQMLLQQYNKSTKH
jgi:tetratricopeptide (TPR) repeat protein